ncbi:MAG: TetR/AcrR family transcriptional regulator [Devosia sp.]
MSPDTKIRILDGALVLFNERASTSITTNHIAEALGMSPGNLYYHYRNKTEIIRALFARIAREWAQLYALAADKTPTLADLDAMVRGNFEIQWRYRFFFRELTSLLMADPELATAYRDNRSVGFANTHFLIAAFAEAGILNDLVDADAIDDVAQLLWLVGDFWLVFKDVGGGAIGQAEMDQGVRMFRRVLTPHIERTDI